MKSIILYLMNWAEALPYIMHKADFRIRIGRYWLQS